MASCKCGNRIYKSIEIPLNAKIQISPLGKEYYVSGIEGDTAIIRLIESNEIKRVPLKNVKV